MDQVRRDLLDQQAALVQRLSHELDVEVLEVAQPAVDQLAGTARSAGREVTFLEQGDRQAAAGGIQCDTTAGHAPAHDEDVERLGRAAFQSPRPHLRSETTLPIQRHQILNLHTCTTRARTVQTTLAQAKPRISALTLRQARSGGDGKAGLSRREAPGQKVAERLDQVVGLNGSAENVVGTGRPGQHQNAGHAE